MIPRRWSYPKIRSLIRLTVLLHTVALLVFPKNALGFRPEDLTGALTLAVIVILAITTPLAVPTRWFARLIGVYLLYFLCVLVLRDFPQGYYQASVFWFKEASYIAFGYLIWLGYRTNPQAFIRIACVLAVPNLAYGFYQILTGPSGIYGAAPFGHAHSPSSAGMVYFGLSLILFTWLVVEKPPKWAMSPFLLSLVLVFASGSKIAVVGAAVFFGWYMAQTVWNDPTPRALIRLTAVIAVAVAATAVAVALGSFGAWSGLGRYAGFLQPVQVLAERGIWWKLRWIDSPLSAVIGAGYSPPHVVPGEPYTFGMAMDNQGLYYLVTGGALSLVLYFFLLGAIYVMAPPRSPEGKLLRAGVMAYVFMGLGAEVLQLSIHGNVFWLLVGMCLALTTHRSAPLSQRHATP
ncbi:MAG TPA: hypothetical protein VEC39_00850 [Vicinamibacterales bacterium]|nr:hypothetical protein [Vicinamibacterales bacterium]